MDKDKILSLRMERQCLTHKASETEYTELYRDLQPGQNVYWNGFGDPPSLSFRADFDDIDFNRRRQADNTLIKGRFSGGNVGWIEYSEVELFAALYRKPLEAPSAKQSEIYELIEREGPLTIHQIKEATGMLVKDITPVLHRLQEAFLIYEDQFDGEWDRSWCLFSEMFEDADLQKYTRHDALRMILRRFAYRQVLFDTAMAKSFYRLPEKEIKAAVGELVADGVLTAVGDGYMPTEDVALLQTYKAERRHTVFALHRNDFLYKSNEHVLKEQIKKLTVNLPYDSEPLQYLLIDGEFHGASVGHFRNGPYDLNDVVCDLPDAEKLRDEIIGAVAAVNFGRKPSRFMGGEI